MNGIIFVLLVAVFIAVVLGGYGVYFLIRARAESAVGAKNRRLGIQQVVDEDELAASLLRDDIADTMIARLGRAGEALQETLRQADMDTTVSRLVGTSLMLFTGGLLLAMFVLGVPGIGLAVILAYLPFWWVNRRARKRSKKLVDQLPDTLEMMGRAMQTGAGLTDCFRMAATEMSDPVASEFGRVADEVKFGKDWRLSLEGLVKRNPTIFDLRLLVSSLLLQRETGGNMIDTLARISKLIRQRASFDGKVKAMTSEARASGLVLALMPLAVLVMVFFANSEYLEPLWTTVVGQIGVVYAVVSYGLGLGLMNNMSQVEV